MLKKYALALGAATATLATASAAQAAPVQWTTGSGGNGHWYDFVAGEYTWTDARAAALASTHWSENGYLLTVTSQAEQDFFIAAFGAVDGWLGGSDASLEGEWRWMDGPEAGQIFWQGGPSGTASGYTNWHPSNPSNSSNEDYLHVLGGIHGGLWNDATTPRGFYVEYAAGLAPGVPEPSTWALFILGFGAVGAAARRSRRVTLVSGAAA